ncbi:MAG: bifunctional phosphoribosylaminoimidazolecarboxamide formyltransferase/IMP cyclohydrolase [Legionellales bacterium]|nr:bifunctional phosphoribosylaminoimidazolecarboxamide formyltransferase/IMP cyclohydrolase [Legionellales bacterium]
MNNIKRALISVTKKDNLINLAKFLVMNEVEIVSTSGTKKYLNEAGIKAIDISEITKQPESFDGRVKTLDFKLLSGILFDRGKHSIEAEKLKIKPIDLVVCNFYCFPETSINNITLDSIINSIDIGGVTLVRAAAKNFKYVTTVVDSEDYDRVMKELSDNNMTVSLDSNKYFMAKTFSMVAKYDAKIAKYMNPNYNINNINLNFAKHTELRYGENPHQKAIVYRNIDTPKGKSLLDYHKIYGPEMSYNNILDLNGALGTLADLSKNGCCIVKHNTPCGLSEGTQKEKLLELAWECDPISAFGSVIACNYILDKKNLEFLQLDSLCKTTRKFVELIAAPGFTKEAMKYLKNSKNIRIISINADYLKKDFMGSEFRIIPGGVIVQDFNIKLFDKLECVTENKYEEIDNDIGLIEFGLTSIKHVKSNAIAIVFCNKDNSYQVLGQGSGQPNRLNSVKLAITLANNNLKRKFEENHKITEALKHSILISEAFFPFGDSIDYCAKNSIKTIIQPGGSINDEKIIDACNKNNIAMYFTGTRHFKH